MLYFLYGNDTNKSREKLHDLLELAKKKRPEALVFRITSENWSENEFEELIFSQGLFSQKYTVVLDNLFDKKEIKLFLLEKIEDLKNSEQIFLLLDGTVDSATVKKISKFSEKSQEFIKKDVVSRPDVFLLANHLLKRDKRRLWISYINIIKDKISSEEIHGVMFWQVKNMLITSKTSDLKSSGLAPFAYKNALSGSKNYSHKELLNLSDELVQMAHNVRNGSGEMDLMLEKWILTF